MKIKSNTNSFYLSIVFFYLIAYAFTGLFFGITMLFPTPDSVGLSAALPELGPLIATLLFLAYERRNIVAFLRERFTVGKINANYLIVLVPIVIALLIALRSQALLGVSTIKSVSPGLLLLIIAVTFIGAAGEEIGWRGYLLPKLQTRFSPMHATIILGVLWAFWHTVHLMQGPAHFALFFVFIMGLAFFLTFLYNKMGGSLWAAIIMHSLCNLMPALFLYSLNADTFADMFALWAWAMGLCAALFLLWKRKSFSAVAVIDETPGYGL